MHVYIQLHLFENDSFHGFLNTRTFSSHLMPVSHFPNLLYIILSILCFMNEQATVMNENTSFNFIRSTNLWFYDGFYTRELNRSMSTVERYFHIITSKIRTKFKISMLRKIANVLNISMVLGYPLSLPEMYKFLLNLNYLSMWCSFKFSAFYLYQTLHLFIGLL